MLIMDGSEPVVAMAVGVRGRQAAVPGATELQETAAQCTPQPPRYYVA